MLDRQALEQPSCKEVDRLHIRAERYAQIENEMLAIVFSLKKFHQYTYGRHVKIQSDHKPLESILQKPLECAPRRLQGMVFVTAKILRLRLLRNLTITGVAMCEAIDNSNSARRMINTFNHSSRFTSYTSSDGDGRR